jgi:predicted NAD/FAD-dependent oxidoreductase
MMDRRTFLHYTLGASLATALPFSCKPGRKIGGSIVGSSANTGHLLRTFKDRQPGETEVCKIVIVGAGVSGLSAAYHLKQSGEKDFCLLDLEAEAGGNARSGSNEVSAFPWGAHYVPTPNNDLKEYLDFLQKAGVLTGYDDKGLPVYKEEFLCFDPEERLYINGRWQEGLVPHFGVPESEAKQIKDFLALMEKYRYQKGADGKDAFAIPADASSKDQRWTALDKLTMKQWLQQQNFTSAYLHQYINYCCRDDYGTPYDVISAWMGINYFACRKGQAGNAASSDVLTWPEGNGFLVRQLLQPVGEHLQTGCLAMRVHQTSDGVQIIYLDTKTQKLRAIKSQQCILAVPQFVAARLLQAEERKQVVKKHLHYAPWMVANFSIRQPEERSGAPLSWDNVLHNGASLGYVEASHQLLQQHLAKRNFTYYLPLTAASPEEERKAASEKKHEDWVKIVVEDLQRVHPNIEEAVDEMNVLLWGHAMAQPLPGMMYGGWREQLAASVNSRIHFAHTDLAGNSIFEEAFYQGLQAAKKCLTGAWWFGV